MELVSILGSAKKYAIAVFKGVVIALVFFAGVLAYTVWEQRVTKTKTPTMVVANFTSIGITNIGGCVLGYYVIPNVGQIVDQNGRLVTCTQAVIPVEKYNALVKSWNKRESV